MEKLNTQFALGAADESDGTFRGIASVFGSLAYGMVLTKFKRGAFKKTLSEHGHRVKLLWQHRTDMPIGKPITLTETDLGLDLHGRISKTTVGVDCLTLMRDKVIDELSIGFDALQFSWEHQDGQEPVRIVTEAKLWEISAVTFAADEMARVTAVHSLVLDQAEKLLAGEKYAAADKIWLREALSRVVLDEPKVGPEDAHVGRVLSGKNVTRLKEALRFLQDLLAEAEPPKEEESEGNAARPTTSQATALPSSKVDVMTRVREAELALAEVVARS